MLPRVSRKPLTDMTNSRKPLAKDKSSMKNISGFKAPEKSMAPPEVGRKPLCDLTNLHKPRAQEKFSKNCVENVSTVNKEQAHSFALEEVFLHNRDECIKADKRSMDYFEELFGLKRDSTPVITPGLPRLSNASELEIETSMEIDEMEFHTLDICSPPSPCLFHLPPSLSPRCHWSPCSSPDLESLEFYDLAHLNFEKNYIL